MPETPKTRWYDLTPDRFLLGLLLVVGVLLLSEWFSWFPFNERKVWTVLIATGGVCVAVLLLLLWFAVSVIFRRRFQFSIRSLLVFVLVCAVVCSWFAVRMKQARRQREAVAQIRNCGGLVFYSFEEPFAPPMESPWLAKLLGDDWYPVVGVHLQGEEVTDADLVHLKELTSLKGLSLWNTQVTDPGLEHLKGLTSLKGLSLWNTQVTDPGLEHLKGLTSLQALYLRDTKITGDGLEHLKGLTSLTELGLSGTQITDAGLEHLRRLTGLEWLDLGGTQVTEEGLKRLRQALPNCEIVH